MGAGSCGIGDRLEDLAGAALDKEPPHAPAQNLRIGEPSATIGPHNPLPIGTRHEPPQSEPAVVGQPERRDGCVTATPEGS